MPESTLQEKESHLLLALILTVLTVCLPVRAQFIAPGCKLTPLTDDGKSVAVAWAPHGDLICFVREITGTQKQLLIMKPDGTDEKAVTPVGNPIYAEWSWSGKKLAFEFTNSNDSESQGGVYIYDVLNKKKLSISQPFIRSALDPDDGPVWSADDKLVVYLVRVGPARTQQIWFADTVSGKYWRLLARGGKGDDASFSPSAPTRISLKITSGGSGYDIATVDPESKDLTLLTNIGAESIRAHEPAWSPTGEWVAFFSDADMMRNERQRGLEDVWIARPDGSQARNLTNASSPATENQLDLLARVSWSWDGRWMLTAGQRFDNQGNGIPTLYLVDPAGGGYSPILTSDPQTTGELISFDTAKWSYDSTKIALVTKRYRVKNWGRNATYEQPRRSLSIYDVRTRKLEEILKYDEDAERKKIVAYSGRSAMQDISWSPDSRSILLTIATIVSKTDNILQPDVYRLDLPERFIDASAAQHNGPRRGRTGEQAIQLLTEKKAEPVKELKEAAEPQPNATGIVTTTIEPLHMTVAEAATSLSSKYGQYFTTNAARNVLLFKGPYDVLKEMRSDLQLIDSPPPHILVDLLAVELTDEANKNLGLDWTYTEGHIGLFQPTGSAIKKYPFVTPAEGLIDLRAGTPSGALENLATLSGVGQMFFQGVGTLPREFFIRLNTLVQDGQAKIIANPRNVAMSGKESKIQIRKTLNFFFNEGFDVAGRPIVKKSDITADTEGRITPTLLADGKIHLLVDVSVGSFTFSPEGGLPERVDRKSTTEVVVAQGQTIVIGGLRQQEMTKVTTKVPILGDIPILDMLFKKEESESRNSVLTIFITPQILRSENPTPDWPQLNPEDHKLVPIMPDPVEQK
jgi:type II secretory pathway component GspD/PulD (secretin)